MSFLNRLAIIILKYFEENTSQYSSVRRGVYVCVLRVGPDQAQDGNSGSLRTLLSIPFGSGRTGLKTVIQARCELYFPYPSKTDQCSTKYCLILFWILVSKKC